MAELHVGRLVFWGHVTPTCTAKRERRNGSCLRIIEVKNDEKQRNASWRVARSRQEGANEASSNARRSKFS